MAGQSGNTEPDCTTAEQDVPAAAYVRISTDHQKYSAENQLDVIRKHAETRGLKILRTFEDSGGSGLRLDGREALQSLMAEVQSGQADVKAILVYNCLNAEPSGKEACHVRAVRSRAAVNHGPD